MCGAGPDQSGRRSPGVVNHGRTSARSRPARTAGSSAMRASASSRVGTVRTPIPRRDPASVDRPEEDQLAAFPEGEEVAQVRRLDLVDLGPRLIADRAALEQEEPEPPLPSDGVANEPRR